MNVDDQSPAGDATDDTTDVRQPVSPPRDRDLTAEERDVVRRYTEERPPHHGG
ncbi:MAG: hypothetical protein ABI137_05685 [Antricoccus sp.]